ncbi:methyltransferase [Pseudoxanthomonas sp. SGNA-20]|uniref:major capsid protein n=1 Tax=Pseudoxanthomonas sp. SGNA-20 TaxID=2493088 RepID=UPI000F62C29D|nr:major capsid protein [Pseudoxanthomonas sp. SGNA-20]RRN55357.1 methyltransferase [Pseudoxanthomonas sp. SGNA-20]
MFTRNKLAALTGTALALTAPFAFASGGSGSVDVSGVTSAIEGAAGPIAAIGGAVLIVLVGIKVYKWVRRAM